MRNGITEWQLDRKGSFHIQTRGQYHCGTSDSLDIFYNLKVVASSNSLDDRGFLFDQTQIQKRMESMTSTALSCERFAHYAAQACWKQISDENASIDIRLFELTLSPQPYMASITFRWKA